MIHAAKKIVGVPDFAAIVAGVLKMPMPITRLTTIIVRLNKFNFCFSFINNCESLNVGKT